MWANHPSKLDKGRWHLDCDGKAGYRASVIVDEAGKPVLYIPKVHSPTGEDYVEHFNSPEGLNKFLTSLNIEHLEIK